MQIFIISHYEKMSILTIMPVRVDKKSIDFDPYTETVMLLLRSVISM